MTTTEILAAEGLLQPGSFAAEAWAKTTSIRAAIDGLPLLKALSEGTLERDVFRHYMLQDALYLNQYSRSLAIMATKAPDSEQLTVFLKMAQKAIEVEQSLHAGFLDQFGLSIDEVAGAEPSPTCLAYTDFVLATVHHNSYAVGLTAILPCAWIYWDVGETIKSRPAMPGNPYQAWIDAYGNPDFAAGARQTIALTERAAQAASPAERAQMMAVFTRACQYEWMFWDSAWNTEKWPV